MSIFAISDLHLPLSVDKPMNVFGEQWDNYVEKLRENWNRTVGEDDIVVMPGDISWATYLSDAYNDFEYIESLSGRKVIGKGNHDYWWETMSKLRKYTKANDFSSIEFLHNNAIMYRGRAICGTRGWNIADENSSAEDVKMFEREKQRLILSLEAARSLRPDEIIVATHYPPVEKNMNDLAMIKLMKEYGVKKCVYGHLHAAAHNFAVQGDVMGVELTLVASDYLSFVPKLIAE